MLCLKWTHAEEVTCLTKILNTYSITQYLIKPCHQLEKSHHQINSQQEAEAQSAKYQPMRCPQLEVAEAVTG